MSKHRSPQPAPATTGDDAALAPQGGLAGQDLRILIADPSQVTRGIMSAVVSTLLPGARITEAASGAEVCKALKGGATNVAFVAMDFADMNGAEAVASAREDGGRPLVILMAQEISDGWEAWSREVGAYEILEKPLQENEIRQIIANYLRMKEPCRVLVADDSKAFRHLFKKTLAASRFEIGIDVVDSGELAISMLRQHPYDVVFLDYDMPGLDGLESACLVQEICPSARVVMISAHANGGVERAARYFGAVDFLKKPFYPADIDKALHLAFDLPVPTLLDPIDEKAPNGAGPGQIQAEGA